jgi:hypothetical protein
VPDNPHFARPSASQFGHTIGCIADQWLEWRRFPDPRKLELLTAPFGPGCYELRDGVQLVLYGMGGHVAERMASILPAPLGCGHRDNRAKREFILDHLGSIEYRTLACATLEEARKCERELKVNRAYKFQT